MPGVRIRHPSKRNTTFTLATTRALREPTECPVCHRIHEFKTYHIALDEFGTAIVSEKIVERLKEIPGQPFEIANPVPDPPAQIITPPRLIIRARANTPGG